MQHVVIGTAGHVDHGKTSLVKVLTGIDCDRLPEEQKRGITIELGFAHFMLGDGVRASVIDVPGHEKFVRTMVAGAAGLDLVMLVVAADDAVMPQTREHLAICELLGVRVGVVALSKCDLVDEEMLLLATADVEDTLAGTALEGAAIVPCSSVTGQGMAELRAALADAARRVAPRVSAGRALVPIDRVFTRPGFGTVITGTLLRGELRVGDTLDALPGEHGDVGRDLKVRGLHVHDAAVEHVVAASRVAINLRGDDHGALRRGSMVMSAGWQTPTLRVLAEVRLLATAPALKRRSNLVLHLGTREVQVSATLVDRDALAPGETGLVLLRADDAFAACFGMRLILRQHEDTVGGGLVVDPHPPAGRLARERFDLPFHTAPTVAERVLALLVQARERGATRAEMEARLPVDDDVKGALEALGAELITARDRNTVRFWDRGLLPDVIARVQAIVADFHRERPLLSGMRTAEVFTRLPAPMRPLGPAGVAALVASGAATEGDGQVGLVTHSTDHGEALALRERVAARYLAAGLAPPFDHEVRAEVGLDEAVFADTTTELKRRGVLRMLAKVGHFHRDALDGLKASVLGFFAGQTELSPADFKELAGGLSRKHAIPLLEWLDSEGITRRLGEARVAGPRAEAGSA